LENLVPVALNTQASGTQIHQIGHGDEAISDFSVQEEVDRWVEANEKELKRKASILPMVDSSGYPVLQAQFGYEYMRK
jgi:hypothetical protein